MSKQAKLQQWVNYIQTLHYREIDLTLERVQQVFQRLLPQGVNFKVATIAGTNGKGSSAEMISSIMRAAGYHTAKYTSPHLVRFNERYQLNGIEVSDAELLKAFSRVEVARGQIPLTFFEFGTLIAIDLFARAQVDVAVMEVGLGGRLDAVNILDADVAFVTSLSIDHSSWLGDDLEQIGLEKIGIARSARPCVIGLQQPPQSVLDYCRENTIKPSMLGRDYSFKHATDDEFWSWQHGTEQIDRLPLPYGQSGCQLSNAAGAIMVCRLLPDLPVDQNSFRKGLANATLAARCQLVSEHPHIIVDVAHNEESVKRLSEFVRSQRIRGRVFALCGMLADKQIAESLAHLVEFVDEWHLASIHNERGSAASEMAVHLRSAIALSGRTRRIDKPRCYEQARQAFLDLKPKLRPDDCLLVFGSFFLVGDI
ncbi:MAG: bifunctional tetrahydrofolate synthase/dihydrofolate synthase, partial [Arenicella sp.]|nr:bifunctional tetrahydrofolate synthase/dihydrofolate synthase [Arenicella sp.]